MPGVVEDVRARGVINGQEVEVEVPPELEDLFPPLSGLSVSFAPTPPELCPVRKVVAYMPMSAERVEDAATLNRTLAELMRKVVHRGV